MKHIFTIPVAPITKKNHSQIIYHKGTGKPMLIPSRQYREYEQTAGFFIPRHRINTPVNIKALFYMPTKRKCDLTNLLEALDDVLVKYGCVVDDNYTIITGHDGSRVFVDAKSPRTEVYISEISE